MSLLTIVQEATNLLGIPEPTSVYGNTDAQTAQLFGLVKKEGKQLLRDHDWQGLITVEEITTLATTEQTSLLPAGFDRLATDTEMWNETNDWPINGPVNSKDRRRIQVRDIVTLPQYWWILNDELNIFDSNAGDTVSFEYVSKYWIYQNASTPAETFVSDTDTVAFDEHLMTLGAVWRWKSLKGLDYAEDLSDYNRFKTSLVKADKGATARISTNEPSSNELAHKRTWPGTITT